LVVASLLLSIRFDETQSLAVFTLATQLYNYHLVGCMVWDSLYVYICLDCRNW
jgi:hypothetical protein